MTIPKVTVPIDPAILSREAAYLQLNAVTVDLHGSGGGIVLPANAPNAKADPKLVEKLIVAHLLARTGANAQPVKYTDPYFTPTLAFGSPLPKFAFDALLLTGHPKKELLDQIDRVEPAALKLVATWGAAAARQVLDHAAEWRAYVTGWTLDSVS